MQTKKCICPILGRVTEVKPISFSTHDWELVQCEESGFIFLVNPPSYDAVADEFAWQKTFAEEKQKRHNREPWISGLSQGFKKWRLSTFRNRDKMFSLAQRHVGSKTELALLDVGSGRGHRMVKFFRNFQQQGIDVVPSGIEISKELAAISDSSFAPYGGSVVADTAYEGVTKFPREAFDIIVMSCYLEHEAKPLEVLRRTHSIVKEDGVILVKVPNFNSINRVLRGSRWCGFRFPDHVNYFTPTTLRILADQAGYDTVPRRFSDCLPTSDNMYAVLKKRSGQVQSLGRAA